MTIKTTLIISCRMILVTFITLTIITLTLTLPVIDIIPQDMGVGKSVENFIVIRIYNNDSYSVDNYTVGIIVYDTVPALGSVGKNFYITDINGNPLYYWLDHYSSYGFTFYVKVPHIDPNSYFDIIIRYGGNTNPYSSYNDPNKLFVYFKDFSDNSLSGWSNTYAGIGDNNVDFNIGVDAYTNKEFLILNKTMGSWWGSTEASLSPNLNLYINNDYMIITEVEYNISNGYPILLFTSDSYQDYNFVGFYGYSQVNPVMGNYWYGESTYDVNIQQNKLYSLEMYVSPYYVYGAVFDLNTINYIVGWTRLDDSYTYYNENIIIGVSQVVESGYTNVLQTSRVKRFFVWDYKGYNLDLTLETVGMDVVFKNGVKETITNNNIQTQSMTIKVAGISSVNK